MTFDWPRKDSRESFEINEFIKHYKRLPHGRELEIIEKREKPDYILRDPASNDYFGVELTSVYIDDRSVPNSHMKDGEGNIPYNSEEIKQYKQRLLKSISEKINKAKSGYETSYPLILSVYVNEYISIYIREKDLQAFVKENESAFDQMSPFCEIVFWPLPNESVFSVKP